MSREKADVGRRSFSKTSKRPSNTLLITLAFLAVVILSVSVIAVHASNENTMGGDTPSQTGSISGLVWVDGNGSPATAGDGLYNGNEKPLAGFTVLLYNADDLTSAIAAAQTSSGGTYTFSGLGPGSYVVGIASETVNGTQYLLPWSVTSDNKFTIDTSTYDAAYSDTIQLSDGQNVTGINAGMGLPMSLAAPAGADYTCAIASDGFGFEVTGASTGNSPSDHRLPLQDAINWIKTDAAGNNCTITFMAILQSTMDLGTSTMTFSGTGWGTVTLKGTSSLTLTSSLNTVGQTILGVINVSDGVTVNCQVNITVSGNASVINNTSGIVNISAGTLQNTGGGRAISNFGTMSVSGTAVVQTPTTAVTLYNDNNGTVNISGGTVKNTYNTGTSGLSTGSASAAINNNAGELNISGGVVSSVYGSAIVNATTGGFTNINISGSAQVSSNYVNAIFLLNRPLTVFGGTVTSASEICTVYIVGTGTMTVAGGTVSNTGVGSAIQFESTAKATIMGGTVKATANNAINNVYGTIEVFGGTVQGGNITGYGVNNSADCAMVLGGGPIITGGIFVTPGKLSVSTSGNIFAPGGNKYGVTLSSYSEGAIVAANGHGYISNFSLMEDSGYILVDDGTNLILGTGLVQDVQYVDVNGETKTHDAMILTQAMFDDMLMVSPTNVVYILDQSYYDLSGGWFLINENITLVGNYNSRSVVNFDMMSDTRLIIANGITMTVNCQSIQATNCNLSVYSQPGDGSNTGVLTVMSIGVGGNAHTFINTAYINAGINMSGTSAMTVNGVTGTIKSGFNAYGIVISLGSSLTVNNYGTINGASSGVRMEAYATVNNFATGSFYPGDDTLYGTFPATYRGIIQGAVNGVDLAAGGTLDNYGGITSSGTATSYGGVYTGADALITNHDGGTIEGASNGISLVQGRTTINNDGVIRGTGSIGYGISASGGVATINNNITISGASAGIFVSTTAADSTIDNYGMISASGTFIPNYAAIYTGSSITITNHTDATIQGVGSGIYLFKGNTTVDNSGLISGTGGAASGTASYGIFASGGNDTITNRDASSVIRGVAAGIHLDSGASGTTINNDGMIEGTRANSTGIEATEIATVVNGGIVGANSNCYIIGGNRGISLTGGGTVRNYSTITGSGTAANAAGIFSGGTVSVTNYTDGTITGSANGLYISAGTVTNNGAITGNGTATNVAGIFAGQIATVTNNTGGTIAGASNGVYLNNGGTVNNNSDISGMSATASGINLVNGGTVNNNGTIGGASGSNELNGVRAASATAAVTLVNDGDIYGNVALTNAVNTVTFFVGSLVDGNFVIGANAASTLSFKGDLGTDVTYSTVTGTADIGTAKIAVSFETDSGTLPAGYSGEDIILITGGTASGTSSNANPANNSRFTYDSRGFFIFAKNNDLVATTDYKVTVTIIGKGSVAVSDGGLGTLIGTATVTGTSYILVPVTVASVKLDATAGTGFFFRYLKVDGGTPSNQSSRTEDINSDMTVEALFVDNTGMVMVSLAYTPSAANAGLAYTITGPSGSYTLNENYTAAFPVGVYESLAIAAGPADTGYTFLRWDDGNKIISMSAATSALNMSAYTDSVTFTANYAASGDELTVNLASAPNGATLSYTIGALTVPVPYDAPFKVSSQETLTLNAVLAGYTFLRWDDGAKMVSLTAGTTALSLTGYTGSVTFTANFATTENALTVTLASVPSTADLFYKIGGLTEVSYDNTSFKVSKTESLLLRSDLPGYTFLRWDDGAKSISRLPTTIAINLSGYTGSVTFTANYAAPGDVLTIYLASVPPTSASLFYKIGDLTVETQYTAPFLVSYEEKLTLRSDLPGYTFLRWDDGSIIVSDTAATAKLDLDGYTHPGSVTFTANYAVSGEVLSVTLASDPTGADLFYTIGTLNEIQYGTTPFLVSKSENLTLRSDMTGYEFLRWDDGSGIISNDETTTALNLSIYTDSVTFTANYAATGDLLTIILTSSPAGASLFYTIGSLTVETQYTTPFKASVDETLKLNATMTDMNFLRWDDASKIISLNAATDPISLSGYTGTVTFTANFATDANTLTVILASQPTGADLFYTIGNLAEMPYNATPFKVSKTEILALNAAMTSMNFLRWDDASKIISLNAATDPISLSGYTGTVTFTANFATDANTLTVILASNPTGADLFYTIGTLTVQEPYNNTPFKMSKTENLSLFAGDITDYEFLNWNDGIKVISNAPGTGVFSMSGYDGTVTFTANYVSLLNMLEVILVSDPAGADLYYKIGDLEYEPYVASLTINISKNDSLTIKAEGASGQTFLRWDDGDKIVSQTAESNALSLTGYTDSVTFTARYALPGDTLNVTLASVPTGADLFYTIGTLTVPEPYNNTPFKVSKNETLSLNTDLSGYTFLRWDDGAKIISLVPETDTIVMTGYTTSVTFTANFATDSNTLTVTLASVPTGADLFYKIGNLTEMPYNDTPFNVAKTESLILRSDMATTYTFLRWDDGAKSISRIPTTIALNLTGYGTSVTFTANYALNDDAIAVTLASVPANMSLSYEIVGLASMQYSAPFNVSKSESLILTAVDPVTGYTFLRWDDSTKIISLTPVTDTIAMTGYEGKVTFTANYATDANALTVTLASVPTGADLFFTIGNLTETPYNDTPFNVSKTESLVLRSDMATTYTFLRWDDGAKIVSANTQTDVLSLTGYGTAVTFTANYALNDDVIAVTLASVPTGMSLSYQIVGLEVIQYTVPFNVSKSESLILTAVDPVTGYTFLRWDDRTSIISITPVTDTIAMAGYDGSVTFTANYATDANALTVTLASVPTGADLFYKIGSLTETPYNDTSFKVSKTENLAIRSDMAATLTFLRWDDGSAIVSLTAQTDVLKLTGYGTAVTFTANYALNADALEVTLRSMPAGASMFFTIGTLDEMQYNTPFMVSVNEDLTIRSDMAGYTFLRWDDGASILSDTLETVAVDLLGPGYSGQVTFTTHYETDGAMLEVILASSPVSTDISYTVEDTDGTLTSGTYTVPIHISNNERLSFSADTVTGYTFLRWDDGSKIISLVPSAAPNLSGYIDTVTFTARFATNSNALKVTLESVPTGADLFFTIGTLAEMQYSTPFYVSTEETLKLNADKSGYDFLRWGDDESNIISSASATNAIPLIGYTGTVTFTAYFTTTGDALEVTLLADPTQLTPQVNLSFVIFTSDDMAYTGNYSDTGPFMVSKSDSLYIIENYTMSDYTFLRWDDGSKIISLLTITEPNLTGYNGSVTFTARFALTSDVLNINLKSVPPGASLSYKIGDLQYQPYNNTPFKASKTESLTLNAAMSSYTFLRWDDASKIISLTPETASIALTGYSGSVTFTANFATTGDTLLVTLQYVPSATNADLSYTIGSLTVPVPYNNTPFTVSKNESLFLTAGDVTDYTFLRWDDAAKIISLTPATNEIGLSGYSANVTFTANYAYSGSGGSGSELLEVTLMSVPPGADLSYTIGTLTVPEPYNNTPFKVSTEETLKLNAVLSTQTFLRWDDGAKIVSLTAQTASLALDGYTDKVTFTANFAMSGDILTVTLQYVPAGANADLFYTIGSLTVPVPYNDTPFTVSKNESLFLTAGDVTDYTFLRWDDAAKIISLNQATNAIGLTGYTTNVTFTANYAYSGSGGSGSELLEVTLMSIPGGASLSYTIGGLTVPEIYNGTPFKVSTEETLKLNAAMTSYTFLRWDDGDQIISLVAQTASFALDGYSDQVTFTANFATSDDTLTVTLQFLPAAANADLFYTIGSLTVPEPYDNTPFKVSKNESLVLTAGNVTNYNFLRWDDSVKIISLTQTTNAIGLSGYTTNATFTANYATNGSGGTDPKALEVTLASVPGGAVLSYKIGGLAYQPYNATPFWVSTDENLTINAVMSSYTFLGWDDASKIISTTAETQIPDLTLYTGSVTFTANFAVSGETLLVTLQYVPAETNAALSYTIGSLTVPVPYDTPFTVSKSDSLFLTAGAVTDYTFLRWDDGAKIVSFSAATNAIGLTGYTTSVTFTANYAYSGSGGGGSELLEVNLMSVPGGATLSYTIGNLTVPEIYNGTSFYVSTEETLKLNAAMPTYTFLRWDDGNKIISTAAQTTSLSLTAYTDSVTFTANFAAAGDALQVTLKYVPTAANAVLSYTIGTLTEPVLYDAPFMVSKNESLFLTASDVSNYTFMRWDDAAKIVSLTSVTNAIGLTGYTTSVTFTANYATDGSGGTDPNALEVTLMSVPGGANLSYTIGSLTVPELYNGTPFIISKQETLKLSAAMPTYTFLRWDDAAKIISTSADTTALSMSAYTDSVTFTANFAAAGDELQVTLQYTPAVTNAALSYTIGSLTVPVPYETPFMVSKTETLNLAAGNVTNYTFLRWDDTTKIVSLTPVANAVGLTGYTTSVTFTANYATSGTGGNALEVTLLSVPPGADLYFTIGNLTVPELYNGTPFMASKTESVTLNAVMPAQTFLRWDDGNKIVSINAQTTAISLSGYTTSVTFTANFAAAGDVIQVTLQCLPAAANASLSYTIGTLTVPVPYETPFNVSKNETLNLTAGNVTNYTFLRWDDAAKIISLTQATDAIVMTGYTTSVTFTANYATNGGGGTDANALEVTLISVPEGASLSYKIGTLAYQPYNDTPFMVSVEETLTLNVDTMGYDFLRWGDDMYNVISQVPEAEVPDLSIYTDTVTFTANLASAGSSLLITLVADPSTVDADLLEYIINPNGDEYVAHFSDTGPFSVARNEFLFILAEDEVGNYTFLRWDDGNQLFESEDAGYMDTEYDMSVPNPYEYGSSVTFYARYAPTDDVLIVSLQSMPSGADLSYTVGSLPVLLPYDDAPFRISVDETLTLSTSMSGYDFLRWDDGNEIVSLDADATALSMSGYAGWVTFTANFATTGNTLTVNLASMPTGADLYYTIGGLTVPEPYNNTPFKVSPSETLVLNAEMASYEFLRWDDGAKIVSLSQQTAALSMTGYTGSVTFTANFAQSGDILVVTLRSVPSSATLSYTIGDLTVPQPYNNTPFKVSTEEALKLNAVLFGQTFLRWDDGAEIVSLDAATAPLSLTGYSGTVTFTANFATAANALTVTLVSVPTGASLYYTIGTLTEKQYDGTPFKVSKTEVLSTRAVIPAGYTFLRWDDGAKIVSFTTDANAIGLTGYGSSVTFTARYTASGNVVEVTLDSVPSGANLSYTIGSLTAQQPYNNTPFMVSSDETLVLNAAAMASYRFQTWDDGSMTVSETAKSDVLSVSGYPGSVTFTANYIQGGSGPGTPAKQYVITAAADGGASITPSGTVTVDGGSSKTFSFSANPGYYIVSVNVDGVDLLQSDIDLGTYTFTNVVANHTIYVTGSDEGQGTAITLTVNVVEGSGHTEYSIDGGAFHLYTSPVYLQEHADVVIRAFADEGYEFTGWGDASGIHRNTDDYTAYDNVVSLYVEVHFTKDNGGSGGGGGNGGNGGNGGGTHFPPWVLIPIIILAGLFIWWFFFIWRRYYDVIKPEEEIAIVLGDDRVHRKDEYQFWIEGGFPGTVAYRVGEDGEWMPVVPDEEGKYIIPKGEIIDHVTIECHRT